MLEPGVFFLQAIDIVLELAILGIDRFDVRVDVGLAAAGEKRDCTGKNEPDAHARMRGRERISLACASG